jgi:hypothetical protein
MKYLTYFSSNYIFLNYKRGTYGTTIKNYRNLEESDGKKNK